MMGSASGEKDGIRGAPHGDPWESPESRITKAIRASSAARFDGFRLKRQTGSVKVTPRPKAENGNNHTRARRANADRG